MCVFTIEVPALKCFKFVERRLQREMMRVVLNNVNLSTSMFSGTISKLLFTVSLSNWPLKLHIWKCSHQVNM